MKYNSVTTFLYPLLNIPMNIYKMNNGRSRFINAYLFDEEIKDYRERYIFILVNNYQDTTFKEFEKKITSLKGFVTDYDILDGLYSVKVFKIPEEHEFDYDMFKKGKYSKFTSYAKDKVYMYELENPVTLSHIFNKTEEARKKLEERLGEKISKNAEVKSIYSNERDILNTQIKSKLNNNMKIEPNRSFE